MAKSLYRSVGGDLLRVPTGKGYPNAGKLWRGIEICCPTWAIGDYCTGCIVVCDEKSSVYTPTNFTIVFAGVQDCTGHGGYATLLNGSHTLVQSGYNACYWGVAIDTPGDYDIIVGLQYLVGSWWLWAGMATQPPPEANPVNMFNRSGSTIANFNCRTGGGAYNNDLVVGDCGASQWGHSGTATITLEP